MNGEPRHLDVLDQQESLRRPMIVSAAFHSLIVAFLTAGSWLSARQVDKWGDQDAGAGAVSVSPVKSVPMPSRQGVVNPVANDTPSQAPQLPGNNSKEPELKEDPRAIEIPDKKSKDRERASKQKFRALPEPSLNQLNSTTGQALVSPMVRQPGSGGVGVGTDSPLGDRFGAYAAEVQRRIASKWSTADVDSGLRTAPPTKVQFTILHDGSVKDIRVVESSGNVALDLSAQRAIYDARPLQPLPAQYERDRVRIEFWFELKR